MKLPMSAGEVWLLIVSAGLAACFWGLWYLRTRPQWPERAQPAGRRILWLAPPLAAALILAVLQTVASFDVVDDVRYINMYLFLGLAWVGGATLAFPTAGLHVRDDAIERRNPAVAPAAGGAIIGLAAAFAGGNIGDGPGWWVVVASALIATAGFLLVWHVLEAFTGVAESITVERDVAAGWRLGGFLVALGLVLGRSVAGDWVSLDATVRDAARTAWPGLGLLALAIGLERGLRVTPAAPSRSIAAAGWLPAAGMVALAVTWLTLLGLPR